MITFLEDFQNIYLKLIVMLDKVSLGKKEKFFYDLFPLKQMETKILGCQVNIEFR